MPKGDYAAFRSLDPFFAVVMEGLSKFVDGEHYFDTSTTTSYLSFATVFQVGRRQRAAVPTS